jgi:hypothetical protein
MKTLMAVSMLVLVTTLVYGAELTKFQCIECGGSGRVKYPESSFMERCKLCQGKKVCTVQDVKNDSRFILREYIKNENGGHKIESQPISSLLMRTKFIVVFKDNTLTLIKRPIPTEEPRKSRSKGGKRKYGKSLL